jgi:hypothetical protein
MNNLVSKRLNKRQYISITTESVVLQNKLVYCCQITYLLNCL